MKKTVQFQRPLLLAAMCAALTATMPPAFPLFMKTGQRLPRQQFYSLQSKDTEAGKVAELSIYDEIGFWGVTAKDFMQQLDGVAKDAVEILVVINSPGGDVFDAFAIYNALRRYSGKVTARIDGLAASAASLIAMAGDKIIMPENTQMMIHNPWTIAGGTAADLRNIAGMMDNARDGIVAAYQAKSGQEADELIRMMDETTWMTALEAQALGFCDVIEQPIKLSASARTVELLSKLQKTPADLLAQLSLSTSDPAPADDPANPDPTPTPAPAPDPAPAPPPPEPTPPAPADPSALAAHVYTTCRAGGIGHLAESVLLSCGLNNQAAVDARISAAQEIAGICLAAKLPDMANGFISAGMNVEQARARLFDAVTKGAAGAINNTQPPDNSVQTPRNGPNAADIYAARRSAITQPRRN